MEIVGSIVGIVGEYTAGAVGRELGCMFSYTKYIDHLKTQIQKLGHARERLQHSVDEARRNVEEIEADVQDWLSKVGKITEEANNIILKGLGQANTTCLSLSFPNLLSRRKLSREAKNMAQQITSEIQNAENFQKNKASYRPVLESSIVTKGYEDFETRRSILKGIVEALRDPDVSMIGLYGMAGAGKTMMAKEVSRQTKEEKLFDQAIMVTVSQTPNWETIQQEIAEKLGLHFDVKSLSVRADRLRNRLSQEKRILIIVDDVWKEVDLDHHVGLSFGDHQKQCNILLTSRFLNVLSNGMGIEKNFKVGLLSNSESIGLFDKVGGDISRKSAEFQHLATRIVKECGGLPLAITVVASALKNRELHVWKNALLELQKSNPNNVEGMDERVYSSIELSYNFLREETKSLLLLCSLFREDARIDVDYLLIYSMGMGLFQDITNLEEAKNKMLTLIEHLKDSSLMMDEDDHSKDSSLLMKKYDHSKEYHVKLHDVIRDACIQIASRDKRWYVITNDKEMEERIDKSNEKSQAPIALSLLLDNERNNEFKLPERLETPQLRLLLTNSSLTPDEPLQIPDPFFEGLKELRVLDLSRGLHANQLPSSFCFLENLKALCLRACRMTNIALLGKLKNLEMLDLSESNVTELGREIGQLTRLRMLNLDYCNKLDVIQPNVIGSLTRLEELTVTRGFTNWEVEGVNSDRTNASLSELKNLARLTSLALCIPDIDALSKDIFTCMKLESYHIILGTRRTFLMRHGYQNTFSLSRRLELNLIKKNLNQVFESGLGNLLKRSVELDLRSLEGMDNVAYELDTYKAGFPECEFLRVSDDSEIQYLVNLVRQSHPCSVFQRLEFLSLIHLPNLEKICYGILAADSFGKLRKVYVYTCNRLKNLFSFPIAKLLEGIEVHDCKAIEDIFTYEGEGKIEFPQLRELWLQNLPQLQQFCTVVDTNLSPMPLFNEKVNIFFYTFDLLKSNK